MKIINDNTFNLHNNLLKKDNRYMKVTHKSKLIGVARYSHEGVNILITFYNERDFLTFNHTRIDTLVKSTNQLVWLNSNFKFNIFKLS